MDSMRHDAPAVSLAGATDQAATSGMRPMNHHAGAGQEGTADQAMMAGMQKMNRDMAAAPMTGNPDHDFAAMMLPHHQGAIDMARVELQYGKDRRMRQLAQRIVAAQKKEIAFMQHWLQSHVQK
jgi:uncharacterized protein (DUF305 family)